MIRNYIITAIRSILKHKTVSFINIGGLAIGLAAVILISLYIFSEVSYDRFHKQAGSIYRIGFNSGVTDNQESASSQFTAPFGEEAGKNFDEVADYCRISVNHEVFLSYEGKGFKVTGLKYTDASFLTMFTFPLISGNVQTALKNPNSIVLSHQLAEKLSASDDLMGKTVFLNGKEPLLVTGIITDAPDRSSIQYEALTSISSLFLDPAYAMDWNGGWQYSHFLQLKEKCSLPGFTQKLNQLVDNNYNKPFNSSEAQKLSVVLQPLEGLHLHYEENSGATRTNMYVVAIIAVLILIISCINHVNLTLARSNSRLREIGVRKVLGAMRNQLMKQFIGETLILSLIALILATALVLILFPLYQELSGNHDVPGIPQIAGIGLMIMGLIFLISFLAGSFLAADLSALKTVDAFRMKLPGSRKQILSSSLIVAQFVISTALICVVLIIQFQVRYVKNKSLGFDKNHTLIVPLTGDEAKDKASLLRQLISDLSYAEAVTAVSEVPGNDITQNGFKVEGRKDYLTIHQLDADENLLKTLNIKLVSGNYFADQHPADASGYIINQALADEMGWSEPLGKTISRDGEHKVIGVVQNFHFASMYDKIGPLIITNKPWHNQFDYLAVKYHAGNPELLISSIRQIWKKSLDDSPFEYWFLDDSFDQLYKSEQRFQQLFLCFSILSVLLSLAGVFGLVLLNLQQRTREIGIRKVLGAGMSDLLKLSTRKLITIIMAGTVIAIAPSWYYADSWLQNFAYRINIQWWMFAVSGGVVILFAFVLISIQVVTVVRSNPVKSLHND